MDTVQEETKFLFEGSQKPNLSDMEVSKLTFSDENQMSLPTSRRPSGIFAALRRSSQTLALSAAQSLLPQRRNLLGVTNNVENIERSLVEYGKEDKEYSKEDLKRNREQGNDALTTILSAFYAKLLVVLGIAFPVTEILSKEVAASFYQGFYLYLYLGSISFLIIIYTTVAKEKAVHSLLNSFQNNTKSNSVRNREHGVFWSGIC
ncbi:hypothetical protein WA026_009914 [Henosepilachna vigintioctopunctata]|uniref:Uncharacterized protein n=1 Tax=Henosepilachna vigintioctopunctata TaxID=420089 RepID=A0AAW1TRM3_9CUCU